MRFLQMILNAVDELLDERVESNGTETTTFNNLETKLEDLLQDGVGGVANVSLLCDNIDCLFGTLKSIPIRVLSMFEFGYRSDLDCWLPSVQRSSRFR